MGSSLSGGAVWHHDHVSPCDNNTASMYCGEGGGCTGFNQHQDIHRQPGSGQWGPWVWAGSWGICAHPCFAWGARRLWEEEERCTGNRPEVFLGRWEQFWEQLQQWELLSSKYLSIQQREQLQQLSL